MMRWFASMLALMLTSAALAESLLVVKGVANLKIPADQFSISIGATHVGPEVENARTAVDADVAKVIKVLDELGFERQVEWKTGRYDISPQWQPRPRNLSREEAAQWQPKITGYRVDASVQITSGQLDKAGLLIAKAAKAGANDIGSLHFSLKDPRTSRQDAIRTAARNAVADATTLADATGVQLGPVQRLTLDGASAQPPRPMEMAWASRSMMAADSEKSMGPDVSGGTVSVTATVTAQWIIQDMSNGHEAAARTQDVQDQDQ